MSTSYCGPFTNVVEIEECFRKTKQSDVLVCAAFFKVFKKEDVSFFDSEIRLGEEFQKKILESNISEEVFFNTLYTEINALDKEQRIILCKEAKLLEKQDFLEYTDFVTLKSFTKWENE